MFSTIKQCKRISLTLSSLLQGEPISLTDESHRRYRWRGLRVRMGIHACKPLCKPDPASGRMDYFGPPVNLSARVSGYGRGGQIVMSQETYTELGLDGAAGRKKHICDMTVTPLGSITLKGIRVAQQLYDVQPEALNARTEEFLEVRRALAQEGASEAASVTGSPRPGDVSPTSCAGGSPKHLLAGLGMSRPPAYGLPFSPQEGCHTCRYVFTSDSQRFCAQCGERRRWDISTL